MFCQTYKYNLACKKKHTNRIIKLINYLQRIHNNTPKLNTNK